jgi:hypothetical protein
MPPGFQGVLLTEVAGLVEVGLQVTAARPRGAFDYFRRAGRPALRQAGCPPLRKTARRSAGRKLRPRHRRAARRPQAKITASSPRQFNRGDGTFAVQPKKYFLPSPGQKKQNRGLEPPMDAAKARGKRGGGLASRGAKRDGKGLAAKLSKKEQGILFSTGCGWSGGHSRAPLSFLITSSCRTAVRRLWH